MRLIVGFCSATVNQSPVIVCVRRAREGSMTAHRFTRGAVARGGPVEAALVRYFKSGAARSSGRRKRERREESAPRPSAAS
jgi:hypothetical protein